jgi:Arc/MetJ-type ribon-helix-helix transcriptional regulator
LAALSARAAIGVDTYKRAQMADKVVTLKLNQQQLELIDRTIARGVASDRSALVRLALREQAAKQAARTARPSR